jgi:hypothetical protein
MSTTLAAGTATSGAALSSDTSGVLQLQSGSTPTTAVSIDTSQNVGIGTLSNTSGYQVSLGNSTNNSSTFSGIALQEPGGSNVSYFKNTSQASSDTRTIIGNSQTSRALAFETNATERARIDSSGNLLVGQTSAISNQGTIQVTNSATGGPGQYSARNTNYNSSGNNWSFGMNNSGAFIVYINPTVGGNSGVYLSAGATSWTGNSDERLKNISGNITNALNSVNSLNGVHYTLKADTSETPVQRVGLVAQQVQAVLPQVIDTNEDGYLGIRYSEVVPLLVEAIKELSAKVTALETKVGV